MRTFQRVRVKPGAFFSDVVGAYRSAFSALEDAVARKAVGKRRIFFRSADAFRSIEYLLDFREFLVRKFKPELFDSGAQNPRRRVDYIQRFVEIERAPGNFFPNRGRLP